MYDFLYDLSKSMTKYDLVQTLASISNSHTPDRWSLSSLAIATRFRLIPKLELNSLFYFRCSRWLFSLSIKYFSLLVFLINNYLYSILIL